VKRFLAILGFGYELWMRLRSAKQAAALERVLFILEDGQAANNHAVIQLKLAVGDLEWLVKQHIQGSRNQAFAEAFNIAASVMERHDGHENLVGVFRDLSRTYAANQSPVVLPPTSPLAEHQR
jgi:hypothetical protein